MVEVSVIDTAEFTDRIYRDILACLSDERRARAERCRTARSAYLSAGAGYLLHNALKRAGLSERHVRYGEHGKPYIEGLHFNLSHSGTVAAIAVADGEVGIDIQAVIPVRKGLAERVCTEREQKYLDGFSGAEREREFFRLWTAKESAGKFLGTGVTDPKEFEIDLALCAATRCKKTLQAVLCEYPLDGYCLTVCADEPFAKLLRHVGL